MKAFAADRSEKSNRSENHQRPPSQNSNGASGQPVSSNSKSLRVIFPCWELEHPDRFAGQGIRSAIGGVPSSPTDIQPVLDAMAQSATRLCAAYEATIFRLDGSVVRVVAHHGPIPIASGFLLPAIRGTVPGRLVLDRRTIHVADLQAETEEFPEGSAFARLLGFRTILGVPLFHAGEA